MRSARPAAARAATVLAALLAFAPAGAGGQDGAAAWPGLETARARYEALLGAGGWERLPDGAVLHPGDRDPGVAALRVRLAAEGYGVPTAADATLLDPALAAVVRSFQRRHGLDPDGVVGPRTRAELAVPARERLAQIDRALASWSARFPAGRPADALIVNVPAFELRLFRGGREAFRTRVVVGRPDRPTPLLDATVQEAVVNPSWTAPPRLAAVDLLPKIQADPGYLARNGFQVLSAGRERISSSRITFAALRAGTVVLRQAPGPTNPLGRVKLVAPNPYDVYLHDTSDPALFERPARAYSSGCIRVQRALELAGLLLDGDAGAAALEARLPGRGDQHLPLPRPVPLRVVYLTAWWESDGVHFGPDVYGRDRGPAVAAAPEHDGGDDRGCPA